MSLISRRPAAQTADVFVAAQHKFGLTAVGLHRPGTRRREARDVDDALDLGHELAAGEFLFHQCARGNGQISQMVDPGHFLPSVLTRAIPSCSDCTGKARTRNHASCTAPSGWNTAVDRAPGRQVATASCYLHQSHFSSAVASAAALRACAW